jgi:hypothetical protein
MVSVLKEGAAITRSGNVKAIRPRMMNKVRKSICVYLRLA